MLLEEVEHENLLQQVSPWEWPYLPDVHGAGMRDETPEVTAPRQGGPGTWWRGGGIRQGIAPGDTGERRGGGWREPAGCSGHRWGRDVQAAPPSKGQAKPSLDAGAGPQGPCLGLKWVREPIPAEVKGNQTQGGWGRGGQAGAGGGISRHFAKPRAPTEA